jgi:hypothetical protein
MVADMGNERASGRRRRAHRRLVSVVVVAVGGACGALTVSLAGAALPHGPAQAAPARIEATHLPPLLTVPNEAVELRYDVHCLPAVEAALDEPCAATGSVFVRAGDSGSYRQLELVERDDASEGRFRVAVPDSIARARTGFSYYAVLRSAATGAVAIVPEGGETAPQRSRPLDRPVTVDLGASGFGRPTRASARVAQAAWGASELEVGLEPGKGLAPAGASSFDVDQNGTVHLLDQARRRVLRWRRGLDRPETVALPINGTIADLAVSDDGALHVLETTDADGGPLLRSFRADGSGPSATPVGDGIAQVRVGPGGTTVVRAQSSQQWQDAARAGRGLGRTARSASGRAGRPLRDGSEVVVQRIADEIRVALLPEHGRQRSWRIASATALGEVQLVEPVSDAIVVVVRAYSEREDEFVVLVLDDKGLVERFTVDSADWAEAAPLSRFRLVGSALYQLGSTPEHVFVDRFDLRGRNG